MSIGIFSVEEKILLTLFMQSAVNESRAISLESLSRLVNMEPSALAKTLDTLSSQGYVVVKNKNVFLTNKGLMRVLSRFS